MAQFYFLAVLLNIICGLICVYSQNDSDEYFEDEFDEKPKPKIPGVDKINEGIMGESLFANPMFNLVSGALCLITGIVILFAPYKGPSVIGDLLPASSAIFGGAATLLSYLENQSEEFVAPEILDTILNANKLYIGIACLLFAIIHFVAPGAPLL